jgi:hypothetical protein
LEPFTTPSSTSLNPSAANSEGQADLRVAFPIDEDRHSFANELVKTLNTTFTGTPQHTINPLQLHNFHNDFDLNNPATHSESCFIESTMMGLMFLDLDDGQWNADDSDESPICRNPRGALLEYIVICDFMYILDNPIPLETSSNEASKRPIWNRTFTSCSSSSLSSDDVNLQATQPSGATSPSLGSSRKAFPSTPRPTRGNAPSNKHNCPCSSSSLSSDDVDLQETQPSGARSPLSGSLRKAFPPIPRPTRGNAPSTKHNRPPSPKVLGSKENPIDVEKVHLLFEPIVIKQYVWKNILQFAYADNIS